MILWDLSPYAIQIGSFGIRWYGIAYALGFLLAYNILLVAVKERQIPGLTDKNAEEYLLWLIMGSILSARLFYVLIYNPIFYWHNPLEIPAVWHGGLSIHGGILGAIIITWHFCKKYAVNFYQIADRLVIPLALMMVLVRITNYLNGELWGTITDVSWCVQFPGAEGCRHPSPLYEALYSFVLFWILVFLRETKRLINGVVFWSFVTLYGILRFATTFLRDLDPTDPGILGLGIGQWLSLAMIGIGLLWFWAVRKSGHPFLFPKKR